jgi:hypothetical protein
MAGALPGARNEGLSLSASAGREGIALRMKRLDLDQNRSTGRANTYPTPRSVWIIRTSILRSNTFSHRRERRHA